MKEIDNTPIEDLNVDWGNPDGTGKKAKSLQQVQAFLKKKLNEGYISTATPLTTPVTITGSEKVFYIATEEGDYSNYGLGYINELSIIKSDKGSWKVEGLGVPINNIHLSYLSADSIYSDTSVFIKKLTYIKKGKSSFTQLNINDSFDMSSITVSLLVLGKDDTVTVKSFVDLTPEDIILLIKLNGSINRYVGGLLYNDYASRINTRIMDDLGKLRIEDTYYSGIVESNGLLLKKNVYENYTLEDIFERNNLCGLRGFDDGTYSPMIPSTSNSAPTIDTEVYDTPYYSMKCSGLGQLRSVSHYSFTRGIYTACRVKVESYVQGKAGILITGHYNAIERNTTGFETISSFDIDYATQVSLFIGTTSSPVMTAWIDSPVILDLGMFKNVPTKEHLDALYEDYLQLKKSLRRTDAYVIPCTVFKEFSDNECKAAFAEKMNEYAFNFGMTNTNFKNGSGVHEEGHYSCAKDIAKMCMMCTSYDKLMTYWGQETYKVPVYGDKARYVEGISTYKGPGMASVGDYYHIFGGKSGSWTLDNFKNMNLTLAVKSKVDNSWLIGCIMKSSVSDRGIPFKELIDWLEEYRINASASANLQCEYASAFVLPPNNPMAYADLDLEMVGKNSTAQFLPASMTKLMTAMLLIDHCDFEERITIKQSDITGGSGDIYYEGDMMYVKDILPALLLPSSNTLATAISRHVGDKLLKQRILL